MSSARSPSPAFTSDPPERPAQPTTSRPSTPDVYLNGPNDELEYLHEYDKGGFHPVHLGDRIGSPGRYEVLHKLGYGGFGTVWLCRDHWSATYVALKIHTSQASKDECFELKIAQMDRSFPGGDFFAVPMDEFYITGPNGRHQCLVLPVLGLTVSPYLVNLQPKGKEGWPMRLVIAAQATQALAFLHENGICHGDFRPANILVHLQGFHHLGKDELFSLIGQPFTIKVHTKLKELPECFPEYLVRAADLDRLTSRYMTGKACVIDFGETYYFASPPKYLGIPEMYCPPEELVLLDSMEEQEEEEEDEGPDDADNGRALEADSARQQQQQSSVRLKQCELIRHHSMKGPAFELWTLGCTLFEIVTQAPLFYMIWQRDEHIAEEVEIAGKFPDPLWDQWKARPKWFDDEGNSARKSHTVSLEEFLKPSCDDARLGLPDHIQKEMAAVLRQLLNPEPRERACAEKVLSELLRILNDHLAEKGMEAVEIGSHSSGLSFKRLLD